jgi:hypothetical protein
MPEEQEIGLLIIALMLIDLCLESNDRESK